jgi:hypothetical protein
MFSAECVKAVREFRRSKPWRGNTEAREAKFSVLHEAMKLAYPEIADVSLEFAPDVDQDFGEPSKFDFGGNPRRLVIHYRLSVVTYFTAVACMRGIEYAHALRWAFSLYARMFPLSASRHLIVDGNIVPRPQARTE